MTGAVVTVGLLLVGVTATFVAAESIEAAQEHEAIKVLKAHREELRTRVEGLEAERKGLVEDLPRLRQEAETARKTIDDAAALRIKVEDLQAEEDRLKMEMKRLAARAEQAQVRAESAVREAQMKAEGLEKKLSELRGAADEEHERANRAKMDRERAEADLKIATGEVRRLGEEQERLAEQNQQVRMNLSALDRGRSERGREGGLEYAFGLLTALLTRPAADPKGMEVRRELGSLHPRLLRRHLARLESRPLGRPASSP